MPYYGNSYQDDQQTYHYPAQQPIPQSPHSENSYNQVRVNIPARTSQDYSHIQAYSSNLEQSPIHQHVPQGYYHPSPINIPQYHNQQSYDPNHQQAYVQHNQVHNPQQNLQQQFVTQQQQYQYYQQPHPEPRVHQPQIQQPSQQQTQAQPFQIHTYQQPQTPQRPTHAQQQQQQQQQQQNSRPGLAPPNSQQQQRYQPPPPPPPRVVVPPISERNSQTPTQLAAPAQKAPVKSPVVNVSMIKQEHAQSRILQDSKANVPYPSSTMKPPKQSGQSVQSVQHPSILLSLADEYLEAARKLDERSEEYYELTSTGVGCLEVALKHFKLPPLREAQVALKYAQVLYDETNNLDEAETTLTRSIDLCARMKFIDLKYSMQLLLAKILFRSKPRAAIRDLQNMTQDIETFKHTAWEYIFRLQAVAFDLQSSQSSNLHDAILQLSKIQQLAKQSKDHSVYAFSALLESFLHLKHSSSDSQEHAQECLAKVRSMQLDPDVQDHPQMTTMREVIDLIWSMKTNIKNDDVMAQKRDNFTKILSASIHDESKWMQDDFLRLRINNSSLKGIVRQDGGLFEERDGKIHFVVAWMTRSEIEAMGYLVKGMSLKPLNQHLQGRAERYLGEGYKIPDTEMLHPPVTETGRLSLKPITIKQQCLVDRSHLLAAQFQLELALMLVGRGLLKKAQNTLPNIEDHLNQLSTPVPTIILAMTDYIKGCIGQAQGEVDTAISYFQSQHLLLPPKPPGQSKTPNSGSAMLELQVLAAINTAFIICSPTHPQHSSFGALAEAISSHITTNTSKPISSVYNILLTSLPTASMLHSKQLLSQVMAISSQLRDQQLTSLCLTLIQEKFFRGGVQHPQAIKSARAASHQVKTKWGNPMWCAIAGTMDIESMVLQMGADSGASGKVEDINMRIEEVKKAWAMVPMKVRDALQGVAG